MTWNFFNLSTTHYAATSTITTTSTMTSLWHLDILHEIVTSGTTFKDKNVPLTGVGKGSIGVEIVNGLLSGGAHVYSITNQSSSHSKSFSSRSSALTVVPFNQASKQDTEVTVLVDYIYANPGMDPDHISPFAGIPENGRKIDGLDSDDKSELAQRTMLDNCEFQVCLAGAVIAYASG